MLNIEVFNMFDPMYCDQYIAMAEKRGFEESKVNTYGVQVENKSIRNNSRMFFESPGMAHMLWGILKNHIPKEYEGKKLTRIGDYFRIYKYEAGQYFKAHKDGSVELPGEASLLTMLIYLSDSEAGTTLMPYGPSQEWAYKKIECTKGKILIFDHGLWHKGDTVTSGAKYVLRTDIFYTCDTLVNTV